MFVSGFEWLRDDSVDIRTDIISIRGYQNPPSKPILFVAGSGVTFEQATMAFPIRGEASSDFNFPHPGQFYYSPWKCVAWSTELWRDVDLKAAVGKARELYERIMATTTVADAKAAVDRLNRKTAPKSPLTVIEKLVKKKKVPELRQILTKHGEDPSGLVKAQLVARIVELTAKAAGLEASS